MTERKVVQLPELLEDELRVAEVIARGNRAVLKHPVAVQAAYRALVAEGRRFAKTDEGTMWRARLEASDAIRRASPLWEAATLNVLETSGDAALPSQLIELVAQALSHAGVEKIAAALSDALGARRTNEGEHDRA